MNRFVAAVLTVTIAGYWLPATARAASAVPRAAEIGGAVYLPDGLTPITGVNVKAANIDTRQIYSSAATRSDGSYRLADLPAGTYDLAVESSGRLYAADQLVEAIPGKRVIVTLALQQGAQEGQQGEGDKPKEGEQAGAEKKDDTKAEGEKEGEKKEEGTKEPEGKKTKKKGGGFWRTPWAALAGIVPAAVLLGIAGNAAAGDDDNEPSMSKSKRGN